MVVGCVILYFPFLLATNPSSLSPPHTPNDPLPSLVSCQGHQRSPLLHLCWNTTHFHLLFVSIAHWPWSTQCSDRHFFPSTKVLIHGVGFTQTARGAFFSHCVSVPKKHLCLELLFWNQGIKCPQESTVVFPRYSCVKREVRRIRSVPGNSTVPLITSPKMQPTDHMSTGVKHTQVHTLALPSSIKNHLILLPPIWLRYKYV